MEPSPRQLARSANGGSANRRASPAKASENDHRDRAHRDDEVLCWLAGVAVRTLTRRILPLAAAIAAAALLTGCGAGGRAQPAQDVDQARRQVDQDASLLKSAFVSVRDATSTIARENFAVDFKQMRADVQRVHDDRNTTLAGDPNSLCGTTQTDTDENQVESDQVQVESDVVSLHSNLAALADEVSTLEARARTYRVDQAIVPNYPPTTVPPTKGRIAR